jgi:hypothetical protein
VSCYAVVAVALDLFGYADGSYCFSRSLSELVATGDLFLNEVRNGFFERRPSGIFEGERITEDEYLTC